MVDCNEHAVRLAQVNKYLSMEEEEMRLCVAVSSCCRRPEATPCPSVLPYIWMN